MHKDGAPEADAELDLFLRCGLVGGHLNGGVTVQTQLDGEADECRRDARGRGLDAGMG